MISKIKLIKTFPNSQPLNTEYIYNEKYKAFYSEDIKYTNGLVLKDAEENPEYYEIIYEPKFKVQDFVTDGVIEGFIVEVSKSLINDFEYILECNHLNVYQLVTKITRKCLENDLKIASDTIKLFDKIYFENEFIWVCNKNGRKQPKQIIIKLYLEYLKSNNIQHFEIFQTEEQAKEWFELNEKKYSKLDINKMIANFKEIHNIQSNYDLWII